MDKTFEEVLKVLTDMEQRLSETDGEDPTLLEEVEKVFSGFTAKVGLDVGVKKLVEHAVIPSYAKVGDAGVDLTITSVIGMTDDEIGYGFGIAVEIPEGHVGLIFPRSSIKNTCLSLKNSVGVIDSQYRGELMAYFRRHNEGDVAKPVYHVGERGAQLIIVPYPKINFVEKTDLSDTDRGDGGFGHTGV